MNKPPSGQRLNRFLADGGLGSRRGVEDLIFSGRVSVNQQICKEPGYRVQASDEVTFDGRTITHNSNPSPTWIFNKPAGTICTREDPMGRETIYQHLEHLPPPYQAAGRLDYDSRGLLIITKDGHLSDALMHPRLEVTKIYEVRATGVWEERFIQHLEDGVEMPEGGWGQAKVLKHHAISDRRHRLTLELTHGKKREIRYSLDALGLMVTDLRRINIAGIELGDLEEGASRPLTDLEQQNLKSRLDQIARDKPSPPNIL